MSVHWVKADIALERRDLILTPKPSIDEALGVGGGQISRRFSPRTGGPGLSTKFRKSIRKAHLCELPHP